MTTQGTPQDGIRTTTVTGAGGVPLNILDAGPEDAPAVVLLHGFAQSAWSWVNQLTAPHPLRIVAPDLRGHGRSGKPDSGYAGERAWADDVAAVITGLGLHRPVLGGWSYGGLVVMDYIAVHGDSALSGVVTVDATLTAGVPGAELLFGPDFFALVPQLLAPDAESMVAARQALLELSTARPLAPADLLTQLGASVRTPTRVCEALLGRALDRTDVAASVTVPWLAVHGSEDRVVAVAAAEEIASAQPAAEIQRWEGAGHAPFLEDPARFGKELADFVTKTRH
ncbi:alpha/beta fold hydrolase [Streptomyces sp. NBC_01262]|uniref:alpha/beta fold hydrolase n=1 Tax=Streptomyces sp. NBC_01262 TaxID=2903803 RepID=UPI002E307E33|nr:alpha/beta hydrolase [Streptomyces sp. NBC_01262]